MKTLNLILNCNKKPKFTKVENGSQSRQNFLKIYFELITSNYH